MVCHPKHPSKAQLSCVAEGLDLKLSNAYSEHSFSLAQATAVLCLQRYIELLFSVASAACFLNTPSGHAVQLCLGAKNKRASVPRGTHSSLIWKEQRKVAWV